MGLLCLDRFTTNAFLADDNLNPEFGFKRQYSTDEIVAKHLDITDGGIDDHGSFDLEHSLQE